MTLQTHIPEPDSSIEGADEFSPRQLEFLRVSRRKAVHDALTRYTRGATLAFVIVFAALGYNQYVRDRDLTDRRADSVAARHQIVATGNAVAVEGCNRDYVTISRLRSVLAASDKLTQASAARGDISPARAAVAHKFYVKQLAGLPLPDCRKVEHVVNDNPKRIVNTPTALYPRHPRHPRPGG